MWDPLPVLLCKQGRLSFHAAYITYHNGTYPVDAHLARMTSIDVVFLFCSWHRIGFYQQRLDAYAGLHCHVVICANTPQEHQELLAAGTDAIYCNHNAWLNFTTIFSPKAPAENAAIAAAAGGGGGDLPIIQTDECMCMTCLQQTGNMKCSTDSSYAQQQDIQQQQQQCRSWHLVVNANSSPYKRSHLASLVPNRLHISYNIQPDSSSSSSTAAVTVADSSSVCINRQGAGSFRYLSPLEVAAALRSCSVGGIFSAEEGPCYACTEYLFCGLPVVTTSSTGGRHVWLNSTNSITVAATPEAVAQGVQQALRKLAAGEFDPVRIRDQAVQMAQVFRAELVNKVMQISEEKGSMAASGADAAAVVAALLQELGSRHKLGLV